MLPTLKIRRAILRLIAEINAEGHMDSKLEALLWEVYFDKPLVLFYDRSLEIRAIPPIPIKVVMVEKV
jgi:hypothetical protein